MGAGSGDDVLDGWRYQLKWPVRPVPTEGAADCGAWLVVAGPRAIRRIGPGHGPESRVEFLAPAVLDGDPAPLREALGGADNVLYAPPVPGGPLDVESAYDLFRAARRLAAAMVSCPHCAT